MKSLTELFQRKAAEYHQKFKIKIEVDWDSKISPVAHIYTNNFIIRSINNNDLKEFHRTLWGDPEVMKLYHIGEPRTFEDTKERICEFENMWKSKNPFSAFVVHDYNNNLIAGLLLLDHGGNLAQLSYFSATKYHGKGYAKEYIGAILYGWSNYIIEHDMKLTDGGDLLLIDATCHVDNTPSKKILTDFGFVHDSTEEKYGQMRHRYILPVVMI